MNLSRIIGVVSLCCAAWTCSEAPPSSPGSPSGADISSLDGSATADDASLPDAATSTSGGVDVWAAPETWSGEDSVVDAAEVDSSALADAVADASDADAEPDGEGGDGLDALSPGDAEIQDTAVSVEDAALDTSAQDVAVADSGTTSSPWADVQGMDTKVCPFGLSPKVFNCGFQGVCAGKVSLTCVQDQPVCDYTKVPGYEAVEVTCDGLDNDCDGATDNNLAKPIAQSLPNLGVCQKALMVCAGSKGWREPKFNEINGFEVVENSCDGLDNDCDGVTDADIQGKPPLSTGKGVCGSLSQVCVGGVWSAPSPVQAPQYEPVEISCDGLDNDCDGLTDESLVAAVGTPTAVTVLVTGVCTGAKPVCLSGTWQPPDYDAYVKGLSNGASYEAVEVTCDGLDNDCDGLTDEELIGPPAAQQKGVCLGARKLCAGQQGWIEPPIADIPGVVLGPELTCDGLDNDCDGLTDEEGVCPQWQLGGVSYAGAVSVGAGAVYAVGASVNRLDAGVPKWQRFSHPQPVLAVSVDPSGKSLATVSTDVVLRVQDLANGQVTSSVYAQGSQWTAVDWAPDSKRVVVGDVAGWVRLVSMGVVGDSAKKLLNGRVNEALWLKSGPWSGVRVVIGGQSGQVRALQPDTGATWSWHPATGGPVADLASSQEQVAVAWGLDGVAVYQVAKGTPVGGKFATNITPCAVTFEPSGDLWVADVQGDLRRYSFKAGAWVLSWSFVGTQAVGQPLSLDWLPSKQLLLGGRHGLGALSLKGAWTPWLVSSPQWGKALATGQGRWARAGDDSSTQMGDASGADGVFSPHGAGAKPLAMAIRPAGGVQLLSVSKKGQVARWNQPPQALPLWKLAQPPAGPVTFSTDGAVAWRASGAKVFRMMSATDTGKLVYVNPQGEVINALAAHGSKVAMAVAASPQQLRVFDGASGKLVWQRGQLQDSKHALAWSPSGLELLVSGGAANLNLLSAKTGVTLAQLPGHLGQVTAVAWSGDSTRFVSASSDGLVRLWKRTPGGAVGQMTSVMHCQWPCIATGGVVGVGFVGPKRWASLASDGALIMWSLPPP